MPSTRDIRRRIKSVKNTAQITKAMQMVASSKMRKAQLAALAGRPYAQQMNTMLADATASATEFTHALMEKRGGQKRAVILVSTDKGLCGALNSNLFREAGKLDKDTTVFVCAGKKGAQFVSRTKRNLAAEFTYKDAPLFAEARAISKFAQDLFLKGEVDHVDIMFTNFVSTLVQKPELKTLLPIGEIKGVQAGVHGEDTHTELKTSGVEFQFEPGADAVLGSLLPHYLEFPSLPDFAGSQGIRAQLAHGGDEERDRQREAAHQRPHARIQQAASGEHHEGTFGNHHRPDGARLIESRDLKFKILSP
jgi:F-type H+-transporting ATPase subunit gamma